LQGFFSGSELALVSADRVRIRADQESGVRSARLLGRFLEDPERILTTTLIGTNLCVVSATTLFAALIHRVASDSPVPAEVLTVVVFGPVCLLFGELTPKSYYRRYSSRIAPIVIHPLTWLSFGLFPLVAVVSQVSSVLLKLLGGEGDSGMAVSRDELRLLLQFDSSSRRERDSKGQGNNNNSNNEEDQDEEAIEETEREMIHRIFDFPEVIVREVMRPLIDVVAISEQSTLKEAADLFLESGYSRLPVYHERVDDIIGVLRARELLREDLEQESIINLVRGVPYVPDTQKVDQLLTSLQRKRQGMAVVVDEYGGAQGLVTIEDILEEIVGEIEDEHDEPAPDIHQRGEFEYIVSARVEVDRLNEQLGMELEEGNYETLAGYLLEHLGQIPRAGDQHRTNRAVFTIVSATSRVVEKVQILLLHSTTDSETQA
jgi:CBS domain containing-hemolysin-like protein